MVYSLLIAFLVDIREKVFEDKNEQAHNGSCHSRNHLKAKEIDY